MNALAWEAGYSPALDAAVAAAAPSAPAAAGAPRGVRRTLGSAGGLFAADVALRRLFRANAIAFPSQLAGMLLLFLGLSAYSALAPARAASAADAIAPGAR